MKAEARVRRWTRRGEGGERKKKGAEGERGEGKRRREGGDGLDETTIE
jgi:hypothetical protein